MGLGIRDLEKTYSGSRIQGSKRHRIPDPDPQHWLTYWIDSQMSSAFLSLKLLSYKECCGSRSVSGLDPDSMGSLDPYPHPDSKSGSVSGFIIRFRIRIHLKCWIRIRIRLIVSGSVSEFIESVSESVSGSEFIKSESGSVSG
jgi:hypothetical protein